MKAPELKYRTPGAGWLTIGPLAGHPGLFVRSPFWIVSAASPVVSGLLRKRAAGKAPAWFAAATESAKPYWLHGVNGAGDPAATVQLETLPATQMGDMRRIDSERGWSGCVNDELLALVLTGATGWASVTWTAINQPIAVWQGLDEIWGAVMPIHGSWEVWAQRAISAGLMAGAA